MKEVKFEDVFRSLKNNLRLILISTLSVTLVSAIITFFFIPPEYEASTKVYIGKERFKNVSTTYTNEEINMYQRLIKTYSELVKTKDLVRKSISNVGQDISVNEVLSKLQAISIADTQILQIKYVSDSREEAYDMVYGITEEFMKLSKKLYPKGNVHIIQQPIVPEIPVGPNKKMNVAIGALLGMMIGLGVTFLKEFINNTYSEKEEVERDLEIPCIGVIPKID
ncbi:MAG: Wzz/FepE/Etk N-terminal domain-containing protein [Clostridium sp.]|nr:Wzz/FepE/Etk N-terminal domain-containing protein [Clostridium sp.]